MADRVGRVTPEDAYQKMSEKDIQDMAKFVTYMIARNGCLEIRVFNHGTGQFFGVGYFDDAKELVKQIYNDYPRKNLKYFDVPRDGEAVFFFSLNTLSKNFLCTSNHNKIGREKSAIEDKDVLRLRHILVDVDPVRSPSKIASTDAEKAYAKSIHDNILRYFKLKGITPVLCADSGNGYHILIPVDYPVEDSKKTQKFLSFLDKKFSTEFAKVDTSVYNPGRICKLYHTWVVKGEYSSERPHRRSCILNPEILDA